jgi:ppGpp synthetase/RelA/SpoT-type nucleotidyltranferase
MKLIEYEQVYQKLYDEFANLIRSLVKEAISKTSELPKMQSSKARAKEPQSLRDKLKKNKKLNSNNIENEVRDLAGIRLIFYTNTDVDTFLQSRLIPENFEVHWEYTRIHHPVAENEYERYQGIHYTVSLSPKLAKQKKYKKFKGMKCEIQIQSILNHAWSDTYHAVGYKAPRSPGFGSDAISKMDERMKMIMDDYLIKAGFEFQKVQKDFKNYMQGKTLYDNEPLTKLKKSLNNNERHELLEELREFVLPHVDDIHKLYAELISTLEIVIRASRKTKTKPIKSIIGNLDGKSTKDVSRAALKIIDELRYVDIIANFKALLSLYSDEQDKEVRQEIMKIIAHLAKYNLDVWKQVGPGVQLALADILEKFNASEAKAFRSISVTAWEQMLRPDMDTSSFKADKVTISSGALPVFDNMVAVRKRAIDGLFKLFDTAATESEKARVVSALRNATLTPGMATSTNDLYRLILENTKYITDLLAERVEELPYEIQERIEHDALYDYRRAKQIAEAENDKFQSKTEAQGLMQSILKLRDLINSDIQYVRYKTLVGFKGVFGPEWGDEGFDFSKVEAYRKKQAASFIQEIADGKENEWFSLVQRCAETESDDMATFPIYGDFLFNLSKAKPDFVLRLIKDKDSPTLKFLAAILAGLNESGDTNKYNKVVKDLIKQKKHLPSLARHCIIVGRQAKDTIQQVLKAGIEADDVIAVMEAIAFAVRNHDPQTLPLLEEIFVPAIEFLNAKSESRWVHSTWFMPEAKPFFENITASQADLVLKNLKTVSKINHQEEKILRHVAAKHATPVFDFFRNRLKKKEDAEGYYEAIPFEFHDLERELGKDTDLAIGAVRKWFKKDDYMFQFTGGRLLHALYPVFTEAMGSSLLRMLDAGNDEDIDFSLALLANYRGELAAQEVIMRIIHLVPYVDPRMSKIDICLSNTGVVSGPFGFVEAYRAKIAAMEAWLTDRRPKVKKFAKHYILSMKQRIASEQRSAEMSKEIRERDYE